MPLVEDGLKGVVNFGEKVFGVVVAPNQLRTLQTVKEFRFGYEGAAAHHHIEGDNLFRGERIPSPLPLSDAKKRFTGPLGWPDKNASQLPGLGPE